MKLLSSFLLSLPVPPGDSVKGDEIKLSFENFLGEVVSTEVSHNSCVRTKLTGEEVSFGTDFFLSVEREGEAGEVEIEVGNHAEIPDIGLDCFEFCLLLLLLFLSATGDDVLFDGDD